MKTRLEQALLNSGVATKVAFFTENSSISIKFTDGETSNIRVSNNRGIEVKLQVTKFLMLWRDIKHISFEQHKDMKLFVVEAFGDRIELGYVTETTAKRIIEEVGSQAKVLNQQTKVLTE